MKMIGAVVLVASLLLACTASAAPSPGSPGTPGVTVVTTTTLFADLVQNVGGDRVAVRSLVPKGGEVHTYDPSPSDAAALSGADMLVMNGLRLDDWLERFAESAGAGDLPIVRLAVDLPNVEYVDDDESGGANPHLWMDPRYAVEYVERIRAELVGIDPGGQATYDANAAAYRQRLSDLDAANRAAFEAVPAGDRRIVTFHDAFPYFARAYGLEVVGVVVDAPGQDPSAGEVAALIDAIRSAGVRAILSETQFSDDLAQSLASETGARVVSDLYTDTLGDPPVDTYEGAIRYDVDQIVAAMR